MATNPLGISTEAPNLKWRKTKGHIFVASGVMSLVIALLIVAVLIISTMIDAATLVQIKTAGRAGITLTKRVYDEYRVNEDPMGHPFVAAGSLAPGTELAKMGWVEVRYLFIEYPADVTEEDLEAAQDLSQKMIVATRIGRDFEFLLEEYRDQPLVRVDLPDLGRFTYGNARVDDPNDPFFSAVAFTSDIGEVQRVHAEDGIYLFELIDRDVLNFVPEGTAVVQLGDERLIEPEQVWNQIAEQENSQFKLPISWVPKTEFIFGRLERVRSDIPGIYSAKVGTIPEGSIALDAGFQEGDILESVDGYKINGSSNAYDAISFASKESLDDEVVFNVERGGEVLQIPLRTKYSREIDFDRSASYAIWSFLTTVSAASSPERGGLLAAMMGTVMVLLVMIVVAFPLGAMAAVYLEEYATKNIFTDSLQILIANLAGIPSVAYGLIALAVFAQILGLGSSIISGGLTLGMVILPIMIIASREALRAIPPSIREAAYGVGATRWQVIRHQVLPNAMPGIFTGMILSLAQAIGEVAPLLMLGATIFITTIPESFMDRFTVIPMQIFKWALRPQSGFDQMAAAAIILLLLIMILLNLLAVWLRRRYEKTW